MKICRNCGTKNSDTAKFCSHCGTRMPEDKNIMDRYPEMDFIPTKFMNWKKPWVAMILKTVLLIPVALSLLICMSGLSAYFFYNDSQRQYRGCDEGIYYSTEITDSFFDGMFSGEYVCEFSNGSYYDTYYGEKIPNPKTYTKERALNKYRGLIIELCIPNIVIFVTFLCLIFLICGYTKRPKGTKDLNQIADYCQKYYYWGIFRRQKTPKLVFFVKDNKLGILDVAHYCVFLSAGYDYLSWREKNKYLNAIVDGRKCIIDIYGTELR